MVGSWEVNVAVNAMPNDVATAFGKVNELIGAEYTPIAYLGKQIVNGVNHAILAEQILTTGKDTKNIVVIILNDRQGTFTIANIERVVESGDALGGVKVDVKTEIPAEAKKAFDDVLGKFVGATVKPFALLATQVVKGVNYVFAAEITPVVKDPKTEVAVVTVNDLEKKASFHDVLKSGVEVALGKPLGEWP